MFRRKKLKPGPGQESVWDYPRPPKTVPDPRRVEVEVAGVIIASSTRALRLLETSHPPTFYIPLEDVRDGVLHRSNRASFCEWKGQATYFDVIVEDTRLEHAAWYYPTPNRSLSALRDHVAFYPSRMHTCRVGGEQVQSQEGDFYGGWVTSEIVGPFKGGPGTHGW